MLRFSSDLVSPHMCTGRSFRIAAVVPPAYHRLVRPTAFAQFPIDSSRGKILSIRRIFRPDESGGPHAISISVRAPEIDRLPSRSQFTPCKAVCSGGMPPGNAARKSSPHQHVSWGDQQT